MKSSVSFILIYVLKNVIKLLSVKCIAVESSFYPVIEGYGRSILSDENPLKYIKFVVVGTSFNWISVKQSKPTLNNERESTLI